MAGLMGDATGGEQSTPSVAPTDVAAGNETMPFGDEEEIRAQIETHVNSLPEEQQVFLGRLMTPEFATAMGILLGQEAFDFFNEVADPNVVLVPMDRAKVEAQASQGQPGTGSTGATVAPSASNTPIAPPPAGPTQGPLA